jgi:putative glutamine amidotransferase
MTLVGLPACARILNGHLQHATPARYAAALTGGAGVVPVMIPPVGEMALPILDRLDGLLLPGSPSNVAPHLYDNAHDETPEAHDPDRDGTSLPLIREALRRGMPVLAICRGIQELNVALGGSLHQRVHLLDGREDHRGHGATRPEQYQPRHEVALHGRLAALLGADRTVVNSVHGQAIDRLAPGLVVEAVAPDGTIEGVCAAGAAFAFGVQWHPEWEYATNHDSMALFQAFGDACRAYAERNSHLRRVA